MKADIKICGLRRKEDAKYVNEFEEIKYVGFVFAKSKRQIDIQTALEIKENLRSDIKCVGVFTDMDIEKVNDIADKSKIDIIQLHSDETVEMCQKANKKVWKYIAAKDEEELKKADVFAKYCDGILFDTYKKGIYGGTGETFDWDKIKDRGKNYFTILAGGIGEENILQAYEKIQPDVIDISSSVETDGYKDYEKIKSLIRRIRNE
ncbi:MAG: phosphoribosylanthranilate isomerase [Firmicutes bacterium]|nr:phosphoribosylanthranilate isomerase [Bacillota bacterium]